jgi:endonuclease YncB( thermonuclease family)
MKSRLQTFGIPLRALLLAALVVAAPAFGRSKAQTFTGEVSDAMCGAKHMMAGSAAECTRACVAKGAKYALVVGDKVYTLDTSNKTLLSKLDKLAGEKAKVAGTVDGDTITVKSVAAGE